MAGYRNHPQCRCDDVDDVGVQCWWRTNLEGVYLFEDVRRVLGGEGGGGGRGPGPRLADRRRQHVDEAARVVVALQRVRPHQPRRLEHRHATRALAGHAVATVPRVGASIFIISHTFIKDVYGYTLQLKLHCYIVRCVACIK